jgi:hypothetical protein
MKKLTKPIRPNEAKEIGDKLKIDWKKCKLSQFIKGLNVELEHGSHDKKTDVTHDDPIKTAKIVLAHLKEREDYYTQLKKVESKTLKN